MDLNKCFFYYFLKIYKSHETAWVFLLPCLRRHTPLGSWLVNIDHVTWIQASYWSIPGTGSNLALRKLSLDGEVVLRQDFSLKMIKSSNAIWFCLVQTCLRLWIFLTLSGAHGVRLSQVSYLDTYFVVIETEPKILRLVQFSSDHQLSELWAYFDS